MAGRLEVTSLRKNEWYVYVMRNKGNGGRGTVYTGATNRPKHRWEAHNGRRSGGARTTGSWGKDAAEMVFLVGPFPVRLAVTSKQAALSFEKKMKVVKTGQGGVRGRVLALYKLLWSVNGQVTKKVRLTEPIPVASRMSQQAFLVRAATKKRPYTVVPPLGQFEWNQTALPLSK